MTQVGGVLERCSHCDGKIELVLFEMGGTCPHCLNEIVGEDCPTDPGTLEVEQTAQASTSDGTFPLAGLGVVLVALIAIVTVFVLTGGEPEVSDFKPEPAPAPVVDFSVEGQEGAVGQDARRSEQKSPKRSKSKPGEALLQGLSGTQQLMGSEEVDVSLSGEAQGAGYEPRRRIRTEEPVDALFGGGEEEVGSSGASTGSTGSGRSSSLDFDVSGGGPSTGRLTSEPEIVSMIRVVMDAQWPSLRPCYERRLKVRPSLKGRWALNFTVRTDGGVNQVSAVGLQKGDAALETCLVEKVSAWRFQPIIESFPVRRNVNFQPG
jgi:hypothetical protein